jgi:pyruvyl transferase EpsI
VESIKKLIPVEIKRKLKINNYLRQKRIVKENKNELLNFIKSLEKIKSERKIFILDACDHKNLGDQAILMAEMQFIKDHLSEYKLITVGLRKYNDYIGKIKKYVNSEDLIFLHGGGNLGNVYKVAEKIRRSIISHFPDNKIVLFPQTMYFTPDEDGKAEISESQLIFSNHKNLTLIAREKTTYNLMKTYFAKNTVLLTPDIVLYLNKSSIKEVRSGVLFCCRNDIEGILSERDKEKILGVLNQRFSKVTITDTIGDGDFGSVEKKISQFRQAQLVITDRLHGMVFAAITGTPCIAISNYNYKVCGTYEWIKHLDYIKYVESIDQISVQIEKFMKFKDTQYNNKFALPHYEFIIRQIKGKNHFN